MLVVASSVAGEHPRSDPYSEFDVLIRQLEAQRGRESGLESRSNELSANIAGLRDKIIEFVASIQSSEREIAAVEIELGQLEKSYKVAHQELIQNNIRNDTQNRTCAWQSNFTLSLEWWSIKG